jgi:hypothetical protein
LSGRKFGGTSVRSVPFAVILSTAAACPHTHATGTIGSPSTIAGRSVKVLPVIARFTRLPKVRWIAPRDRPRRGDRALGDVGQLDRVDDLLAHEPILDARHRDHRQDRNDRHRDHQLEQREAALAFLHCVPSG